VKFEINKALIVASLDTSQQPAYEIAEAIKKSGYTVDIAHVIGEEDDELKTNIRPDVRLTKDMDLANYKGIIFLDYGGDENIASVVAKRASEEELAIGGYAQGCRVLLSAKLLKGKKIPASLPEEFHKGAELVNAPAIRSDKIIISAGNCPVGFALLVVSAMGGKIKKEVEGNKVVSEQESKPFPRSGLIVASLGQWLDFWDLATKLAETDAVITIAEWDDLDLSKKQIKRFLAIGPLVKDGASLHEGTFNIPSSLWMPSLTTGQTETLSVLAAAGISNFEPVKSIEWSDKDILQLIERELSHHGIWLQDNSILAIKEGANITLRGFDDALKTLKADATYFNKKFTEAHEEGNTTTASGWASVLCKTILTGRLIRELRYFDRLSKAAKKTVIAEYDYSKGTVPGPYSNVRVPERVIPWHEGDDWLDDINWMGEQAIANLSRYHPESKCGFYAEFDLWHENDPTPWEDVEKGDSIYKMREQLKR